MARYYIEIGPAEESIGNLHTHIDFIHIHYLVRPYDYEIYMLTVVLSISSTLNQGK